MESSHRVQIVCELTAARSSLPTSECGTNPTCRGGPTISVDRSGPEGVLPTVKVTRFVLRLDAPNVAQVRFQVGNAHEPFRSVVTSVKERRFALSLQFKMVRFCEWTREPCIDLERGTSARRSGTPTSLQRGAPL